MYHTIHENAESEAIMSIPPSVDLYKAVNALAGGRPAGAWLARNLQRKGVVYVAAWSSSGRRGFIVRRHYTS